MSGIEHSPSMERTFLVVACSGIVLLITAFALGLPSVRSDAPLQENALLLHGVRR